MRRFSVKVRAKIRYRDGAVRWGPWFPMRGRLEHNLPSKQANYIQEVSQPGETTIIGNGRVQYRAYEWKQGESVKNF